MGELYRISDVAKLMGVNPKTLRYYEACGVMAPTKVDPKTGYRYYDQESILCLWQTMIMRESGLSIRELKEVCQGEGIEDQIGKLKRRMTYIRTTISMLRQLTAQRGGYRITENSLPGGLYLRKRLVAEVPDQIFTAFMDLFDTALEKHLEVDRSCPPFARFTDIEFRTEDIHCEVYLPVKGGLLEDGVVWVEVPKAISVVHHGDYSRIGEAYDALQEYADERELEVVDSPMEFYVFGLNDPKREKLVTTVFYPIE